jgi:chromosome segregation protein
VFLKSLTLKGFKSFADATTLQLEPGVTVVVGPNGSGKSNVVDAIAWVLGAQAPSAVRSQKMDDVIFAGTAKRPALGRAEVTLTIDNSAGLLPIEFTEVTVSRILFRTGESEYAINGVTCRLLDVQELLSDAGVGRQQHVIVSQGQIDAVLNARPEDRRSIIEEAAGVLKYRRRKEKAERRLDATEASLLRVQDLLREVRRQLRPLERQADAARRHGALASELSALQVFLAGREIASLRSRLTATAGEKITLAQRDAAIRSELTTLDTSVMAAESELTARGDTDLGDEMVRVEQLRERARGIAAVIVERRRSMERDHGQLMDSGVVANLEAEAGRLRSELDSVLAELDRLGPASEQLGDEEESFARQRRNTLASIEAITVGNGAASAAAEVRGELRSMRSGLDRGAGELRRQRARLDSLRERAMRLDAEIVRLRASCEEAQEVEASLVGDAENAEARRLTADAAFEVATEARQEAAEQLSRWRARADALRMALESARAKAGADHLTGVEGVLGTLLDLIEIDAGWESAVEAALGEALQAVVVSSPDTARRALQSLQSSNVHGAVLALGAGVTGAAVIATGSDAVLPHVRGRHPEVAALLGVLLASAVRARSWAEAVDTALRQPQSVVVTDQGDRFGATGWRLGAAGGGATAAALEEAQHRLTHAEADAAERETVLAVTRHEQQAARQHEAELTRRLDAHDAGFSADSEALARAQTERREAQSDLEAVERGAAEAEERTGREAARVAELEALVPGLEADEQAEAAAARARGQARAGLDSQAALLAGRRKDMEVRNAGLHERHQFLDRRLADAERRLEADGVARAEAQQRRQAVELSLDAIGRLAALVEGRRETVEVRHDELLEIRRRQSDEVRGIAARLDELRRRRATAEREMDETRERSRRVELDEAEVRLRLETAVESLRREHDLEPGAAEAAPLPALPEGVNAAGRVRDLDRELRLLGPINPLALEEFNELQERHTFLETQLEDIRSTRRDLLRVIKAVDLEIQTVFSAAFADVSGHFTQLFEMLFPGGAGKLVLTTPDDLLNTGIEVEAKPSGKNVKKLSLLSGGERSLTALAYLFAVFRSRPSPFYVMDEVEAALDDVNLHRFLGLIHEFRREAQLLVVSHQKRTMEAGDSLLGVTMQPGGSSKVITERVSSLS